MNNKFTTYNLSIFRSVEEAYVADSQQLSLEELGQMLTEYSVIENKNDNLLFNLAKFKDVGEAECARKYHYIGNERQDTYDEIAGTVRRSKNNLVSLSGLVLDVDQTHSIEDIVKDLDGIYMIIYTTFRHSWDHNKFRVVIPFSRPLLAEDIDGRIDSMISTFPGVDHASFSVSQSFYFHSGPEDKDQFSCVIEGELVDPYMFEVKEIQEKPEYVQTNISTVGDNYKKKIVDQLLSCNNMHYDSINGSKNGGVLTLVTICKSIGLTYEEYDQLCYQICDKSSQLTNKSIRRNAWTGWDGNKITKEKRDEFITSNNGKIEVKKDWQKVQKELINKYFLK